MQSSSTWSAVTLFGATLLLLAVADGGCGTEDASMFDPDAAVEGGGGSGFGDGGGGDGGAGDGGGSSAVDSCGGKPCANHAGPKEFLEPDAPPNAAGLFGGGAPSPNGTQPAQEPRIVYPSHETMFPINVSHIRHEWVAGGTNDLFRPTFEGAKTTVTIYTTRPEWEPTEEEWDWIAESNRGGSVTLTVSGLHTTAPQQIWQSKSITLLYSAVEVEGAIYYWSTGSEGIMRALVSDRTPEKFFTDPSAPDKGTCVACHTLSRSSSRAREPRTTTSSRCSARTAGGSPTSTPRARRRTRSRPSSGSSPRPAARRSR